MAASIFCFLCCKMGLMRLVILPHKGEKEVDVDLTESVLRALQTGAFVVTEADGIKVIFFNSLEYLLSFSF